MPASQTSGAPMTATQKILARACGRERVDIGEVVYPNPELVIIHDGYVETVHGELAALGYRCVRDPKRVVFVTDHEVAYTTQRAVERGRNIRKIAKAWDIGQLFDFGRGGHGHIFPMEAGLVRPGMFLFAYDMHCSNFGAIGALAIGVGAEVSSVLATGSLWTQVPETVRIELTGSLPPGVDISKAPDFVSDPGAHRVPETLSLICPPWCRRWRCPAGRISPRTSRALKDGTSTTLSSAPAARECTKTSPMRRI